MREFLRPFSKLKFFGEFANSTFYPILFFSAKPASSLQSILRKRALLYFSRKVQGSFYDLLPQNFEPECICGKWLLHYYLGCPILAHSFNPGIGIAFQERLVFKIARLDNLVKLACLLISKFKLGHICIVYLHSSNFLRTKNSDTGVQKSRSRDLGRGGIGRPTTYLVV